MSSHEVLVLCRNQVNLLATSSGVQCSAVMSVAASNIIIYIVTVHYSCTEGQFACIVQRAVII